MSMQVLRREIVQVRLCQQFRCHRRIIACHTGRWLSQHLFDVNIRW